MEDVATKTPNPKLRGIYDFLSKKPEVKLPTSYDEFEVKMQDPKKLNAVYEFLKKQNTVKVQDSFEAFQEALLLPKKKEETVSQDSSGVVGPTLPAPPPSPEEVLNTPQPQGTGDPLLDEAQKQAQWEQDHPGEPYKPYNIDGVDIPAPATGQPNFEQARADWEKARADEARVRDTALGIEKQNKESNPLITTGKSIWNIFRYQLPSGMAAAAAALNLNVSKSAANIEYGTGFVKKEDREKAAKAALNWANKLQEEGAEFTKDLVSSLDKIDDPLDFLNWVGYAVGQAGGQIPASIATFGASSIGQEIGSIYLDGVKKIAEEKGLTIDEVIDQNLDNPAAAIAWGTAAGALDYVGAKGVMTFGKKQFSKALRDRLALMKSSGLEAGTEYSQTFMEQIGAGQVAGNAIGKAWDEALRTGGTERLEALAQGAVGAPVAGGATAKVSKAFAKSPEGKVTAPAGDLGKKQPANEKPKEQPKEAKPAAGPTEGKTKKEETLPVQGVQEEVKQEKTVTPFTKEDLQEGEKILATEVDKKGRTVTKIAKTTEKDGVKTTNYKFNRSDKAKDQRNGTYVSNEEAFGNEWEIDPVNLEEDEVEPGYTGVRVFQLREQKGKAAATIEFVYKDGTTTARGEVKLIPKKNAVQKREAEKVSVDEASRDSQKVVEGDQKEKTSDVRKEKGKSLVSDEKGNPITVYRGQHGSSDIESRQGSITFSSDEADAKIYSQNPNNRELDSVAKNPNIIKANLDIRNPVINEPDDPFIELSRVKEILGDEEAKNIAIKFSDYVTNTNNWEEKFQDKYGSVEELLNDKPEAINELYLNAFPLFDDKNIVEKFKKAGYDGAIHAGYGEGEGTEYKVFSKEQIQIIKDDQKVQGEQPTQTSGEGGAGLPEAQAEEAQKVQANPEEQKEVTFREKPDVERIITQALPSHAKAKKVTIIAPNGKPIKMTAKKAYVDLKRLHKKLNSQKFIDCIG